MLASLFILNGMEERGIEVVQDIYDLYENSGLRYNHIGKGPHVSRAMCSWSVYLAFQGFSHNAISHLISFRTHEMDMNYLFK